MPDDRRVTLYHSPHTRSTGALILLEELGAPYDLHVLNMKAGEQRQPAYLAVNPMGKVPALRHGDAIITEQVAVYLYLADLFPEAGLAPQIGDPLRGPYLRWMVFYAACFEPAVVDRAAKHEPAPQTMSPYGDYDTMLNTVVGRAHQRAIPARRTVYRGGRAVGHRPRLDDNVWTGPQIAGDHGLREPRRLPPRRRPRPSQGRRTRRRAGAGGVIDRLSAPERGR